MFNSFFNLLSDSYSLNNFDSNFMLGIFTGFFVSFCISSFFSYFYKSVSSEGINNVSNDTSGEVTPVQNVVDLPSSPPGNSHVDASINTDNLTVVLVDNTDDSILNDRSNLNIDLPVYTESSVGT